MRNLNMRFKYQNPAEQQIYWQADESNVADV